MMKYRPVYHCRVCTNKWKGAVVKADDSVDPQAHAAARLANGHAPDSKCPNCGADQTPKGIDLSLNRAPGIIGNNIQTKAIDETAKIVMEDYSSAGVPMTDLRSDVRMHETAAPKLAPRLQQQADGFFVGRGKQNPLLARRTAMMGQAAIKGAFRQPNGYNTVEHLHSMQPQDREVIRPAINIVAGDGVRPPR